MSAAKQISVRTIHNRAESTGYKVLSRIPEPIISLESPMIEKTLSPSSIPVILCKPRAEIMTRGGLLVQLKSLKRTPPASCRDAKMGLKASHLDSFHRSSGINVVSIFVVCTILPSARGQRTCCACALRVPD